MFRRRSSLFLHVNNPPDPNAHPTLWEHRLRQRRPISQNPFVPEKPESRDYEIGVVETPGISEQHAIKFDVPSDATKEDSIEDVGSENKNMDEEWGAQPPKWLTLFYDLAWTATFASLTSNNKFKEPWDSISYIVFFTIAWWLWASQVFYSVDFYTDDWFHLLIVFGQLIIFGALAATTRGFDVSDYILQSPGSEELESFDIATIKPERFSAERVAKISLGVITIVVATSRLLLLVQHLRVAAYAKFTSRSERYPLRLLVVPASLVISTALFFAAYAVTKKHGEEPYGAKIKFILWGVAILVEVIAHVLRFQWDINDGVRLRSHGSIADRLGDITAIILGEGINAIAGTFYAIEKAPGFGTPVGTGIICCAIIVFFLAYLYFEGAAPLGSVRRRAAWALMHLPWLLSVILLLEGAFKNQLLLYSFLTTINYLMSNIDYITSAESGAMDPAVWNATAQLLFLQAGLQYEDQYNQYENLLNSTEIAYNGTNIDPEYSNEFIVSYVWYYRAVMSASINSYITFMDNETISDETQKTISQYLRNFTFTCQDVLGTAETETGSVVYDVLTDLIKPTLDNARYIMALCGLTFICLGTMNLIQSWPRDRFQWASIISRYAMGFVMMLLLVLNVGKYQKPWYVEDVPYSKLAAFLRWIDTNWVLPTLALAYAIQFIVDTGIVYAAVRFSRKSKPAEEQVEKNK
ncbi:hypothetical protein BDV93DRAFT_519090 [Ceratobasidium sp. AG-I]|nr:hypothetical protein BDV93DRAFT_519090 [Ceratobasidium sp. AG-I]